MRLHGLLAGAIALGLVIFRGTDAHAQAQPSTGRYILVQSTTSTENSGLSTRSPPMAAHTISTSVRNQPFEA